MGWVLVLARDPICLLVLFKSKGEEEERERCRGLKKWTWYLKYNGNENIQISWQVPPCLFWHKHYHTYQWPRNPTKPSPLPPLIICRNRRENNINYKNWIILYVLRTRQLFVGKLAPYHSLINVLLTMLAKLIIFPCNFDELLRKYLPSPWVIHLIGQVDHCLEVCWHYRQVLHSASLVSVVNAQQEMMIPRNSTLSGPKCIQTFWHTNDG